MDGLFLSPTTFNGLSAPARREILASLGFNAAGPASEKVVVPPAAASLAGSAPVDLTIALVRKLTDKLSDKTMTALKIIAQSESPEFHMKDVISATVGASTYMDLRGVWSALTRRTRKIMNDNEVDLIWWLGAEIYDSNDNYIDHVGTVSPVTHQSLRSHFGY